MDKFFPLSSKRIWIVIAVWCCLYLFWLVNTGHLSQYFGLLIDIYNDDCGQYSCDIYWNSMGTDEYIYKEEIVEIFTQLLSPIFAFVALHFLASQFINAK